MSENNKYTNYNDHTSLLDESTDQLDTTLEIEDLDNESNTPIIKEKETHILYEICYYFQKTMSVKDSLLFTLTIIICTIISVSLSLFFVSEKIEDNIYYFTPDYKIIIFKYKDIIDTEEKLTAVLMDASIIKEFTPKKGDFIVQRGTELCLESYEHIASRNNIYPLANKQVIDYTSNKYKFIPSVITVSKNPMLAEKIKTTNVQNTLLKKDYAIMNKNNIKIGSFVLVNMVGQYIVILDDNISQEHLIDESKNKLIDINKLI